LGLIAQALSAGAWSGFADSIFGGLTAGRFSSAVLQIVFIDILMSGDNAVVIAMACRRLPRSHRSWGIVVGAGVAVLLRILFAGALVWLLQLPYLRLAGGTVLIYIAAKLLVAEQPHRGEIPGSRNLWRAVRTIAVADFVMSFDNVLAVVEIARGHLVLIVIGLTVSIPLVVAGAVLITTLIRRLPILVWVGSALLGWVGGETIFSDPVIMEPVRRAVGDETAGRIELAAAAAGLLLAVAAGWLWRRWCASRAER
jgi:YjbE family integral membrane protein